MEVVEIALEHVEPAAHGMDVRVLEARQEHPAAEVDDLRPCVEQGPDVVVAADGRDPPSFTATACARLRAASTVYTAPSTNARSAEVIGG